MASRYTQVGGVVGIVTGNMVWGANTESGNTSAWTWKGEDVKFMRSVGELDEVRDYHGILAFSNRGAFERGVEVVLEKDRTYIEVEKINGPILYRGRGRPNVAVV